MLLQNSVRGVEFFSDHGTSEVRIGLSLLVLVLAASAKAQVPVPSAGLSLVNRLFDAAPNPGSSLKCTAQTRPARLDFAFRFDAYYLLSCNVAQFEPAARVSVYLRVKPESGKPVILGKVHQIPAITPEAAARLPKSAFKNMTLEMSGAFALGEGRYQAEVLVADNQERTFRKHWSLDVTPKGRERDVPLILPPHAVTPTMYVPWKENPAAKGSGLRLTILLHAVPMNPNSAKLYAWDRVLLMETLVSLLRQIPYRSIRFVAFNLDQQRELYRNEHFEARSLANLEEVLQASEMATVSFRALQGKGWSQLLVKLTQDELSKKAPSDAVIFLGPTTHFDERIPKEISRTLENGGQPFFYFEYYPGFRLGGEFPDAIHYLTKDLHGTVFPIHTAPELAASIQKMLSQLKRGEAAGQPHPGR